VRLSHRLLVASLVSIIALLIAVVAIIDLQLRTRLRDDMAFELGREARLVAVQWTGAPADSLGNRRVDSLANVSGAALGHRVTLIDSTGRVVGDSEFDDPALSQLENHRTRPEVVDAMREGTGSARRLSTSAGDEELYVAVRTPRGVARVSVPTRALEQVFDRVERDVLLAAVLTGVFAIGVSALLSRAVARPIVELRDVAQAIAGGDLTRRPSLAADGEVGDLARALQRLGEQLGSRISSLEREEALLIALTESLNEGVVAIDAHRRVVRINERGRALLHVTAPVPFATDLLPRDRLLREALQAAEHGESSDAIEVEIGGRTVALTARPLAAGGIVLALFDLTPLRRLEVVRRDFVANVSHELRTPLTVIAGFAETLIDPELPDADRRRFSEAILTNARRMQRLTDDLLDLSRIESGGWVPNPVSNDVRELARDALGAVRDRAASAGIALAADVATGAEIVVADPTAIRQIVANLVDNALRHAPGGRVTVFANRQNGAVRVGVRDTGVGIPSEHVARIFERFYRVDAGRSRADGGTGLGLAIVRHLVEAHGGRVGVESAPGRGTTIWGDFPDRERPNDA
jgi:two-component system, OmpR family, phosphate regulon sensor histidine kinase PhoR